MSKKTRLRAFKNSLASCTRPLDCGKGILTRLFRCHIDYSAFIFLTCREIRSLVKAMDLDASAISHCRDGFKVKVSEPQKNPCVRVREDSILKRKKVAYFKRG